MLLDSGIRSGSDIFMALALGATRFDRNLLAVTGVYHNLLCRWAAT